MKNENIVGHIHDILKNKMHIPYLQAFSHEARLNEDLYLDSVMVLQLLLNLELEYGYAIPEEALAKEDFESVNSLAGLLARSSASTTTSTTTQLNSPDQDEEPPAVVEFEDIKVHCFVSCVCEIIKKSTVTDHRPFYFGVWDADISVDDRYVISYHSEKINHDFFIHWYEQLYGVRMHQWYDKNLSKEANIRRLVSLIDSKSSRARVMVMLDMYLLPERENKFNANPFPHYVMLEATENPHVYLMLDPDYRWEGEIEKAKILNAIRSPHVAGGYLFDSDEIKPLSNRAVKDYFMASMKLNTNIMTDSVREIIEAHLQGRNGLRLKELSNALKELPVLSIRKYAYEHGFAFFWRAMHLDDEAFERWCDVIGKLVETYKVIQYRAMKLAATGDSELAAEILALLDEQDEREFTIKYHLQQIFETWCASLDAQACSNLSAVEA